LRPVLLDGAAMEREWAFDTAQLERPRMRAAIGSGE